MFMKAHTVFKWGGGSGGAVLDYAVLFLFVGFAGLFGYCFCASGLEKQMSLLSLCSGFSRTGVYQLHEVR